MAPQTFPVTGSLTFDLAAGTFTLVGVVNNVPPPPVPVPSSGDQMDLASAVLTTQSPDVRSWPIGAHLSAIGLSLTENTTLEFSKRNGPMGWPFVTGPEGGEIQYTLWVGCKIGGQWYLAGSILCISRSPSDNYVPTGPTLAPGQLPGNWYYYIDGPMRGYQPQPGELVVWFLTAGVQRRNDIHTVMERTQVVLAPFAPGVYTF
jgi:hypothetical protein